VVIDGRMTASRVREWGGRRVFLDSGTGTVVTGGRITAFVVPE
jgi:hypothetical protein